MLLRDLKRDLHPNVVKAVAEIYLDLDGKSSPSNRKLSVELGDHVNFTGDGFGCLEKYLRANNYEGNVESLIVKIKTYLTVHGISRISKDYVRITKQFNILRSKVNERVKAQHNSYDFDRILDLFVDFFVNNSIDSYDWDTAGLGAYMTHAFSAMFLNKYFTEVCNIVNEKSSSFDVEGSTLDLEDRLFVEKTVSHTSFNFKSDVKNISDASRLLFPTNPKNPVELYSNLVSAYKYYTTEKKKPELAKHISNVFCPGATYSKSSTFLESNGFFTSILTEGPNDQTIEYRRFTFTHRLMMTELLFDFMNSPMTGDSVKNLYESLINLDIEIAGNKNKSKLFNVVDANSSFDLKINKDRFDVLLSGIISFKSLLGYCFEKNIGIYSIPKNVFTTSNYYSRFVSLEQCLYCYDVTSSLISNEKGSKITSLLTNDETYDDLIAKSNFNFLDIHSCLLNTEKKEADFSVIQLIPVIDSILEEFATLYHRYLGHLSDTYSNDYKKASYYISSEAGESIDEELLALVKEIIGDHADVFDKIVVDDDLTLAVVRFGWLRVFTLDRMKTNLSYLSSDTRYDTLVGISENKLLTLPTSIDTLDDLSIVNSSIPLNVKGVMTSSILNQFRTLYSIIQKDLFGVIDAVNKLIVSKEVELQNLGIKTKESVNISEDLRKVSSSLYDSAIVNPNQSLEVMLTLDRVKLERGFVTYRSELFLYKNYLVHEYGYLVEPGAEQILVITPSMVIF